MHLKAELLANHFKQVFFLDLIHLNPCCIRICIFTTKWIQRGSNCSCYLLLLRNYLDDSVILPEFQSGSLLSSLGNYFPSSMLKATVVTKIKVREIEFLLLSCHQTSVVENDKYKLLPPFNFPSYRSFQYQSNWKAEFPQQKLHKGWKDHGVNYNFHDTFLIYFKT